MVNSVSSQNVISSQPSKERFVPLGEKYLRFRRINRILAQELYKQTGIELEFPPNQAEVPHLVGKGFFGKVSLARTVDTGVFFAAKRVKAVLESREEARLQKLLTGLPNIMPLKDFVEVQGKGLKTYQIMPLGLSSGKKLKIFLARIEDKKFKEQLVIHIAKGLLNALEQMHSKKIAHLDIKLENLVLDNEGQVKVIDFGCAKEIEDIEGDVFTDVDGDQNYFSPQRWLLKKNEGKYFKAYKADAWAAGLCLLKLLFNIELFENTVVKTEAFSLSKEKFVSYFRNQLNQISLLQQENTTGLYEVIKGLLTVEEAKRLTVEEALHKTVFQTQIHPDTLSYMKEFLQQVTLLPTELKIDPNNNQSTNPYETVLQAPRSQSTPLAQTKLSIQPLPPAHLTGFIPRHTLQKHLYERLLKAHDYTHTVPLTACIGMKGIGKSQLLLSTVHDPEIAQHFGHRHWFHSADKPEQLQTQYHEFARELLELDANTPAQEAQQKLLQRLEQSKKPFLLIFDNARTLDQLKPFLPTKGGYILITSRNPQWPDPIEVDIMTQEEAHQLLEKILQHPDEQIDHLATTLGRHPLALAQAGAYIRARQITPHEYLKRYNGNQKERATQRQ